MAFFNVRSTVAVEAVDETEARAIVEYELSCNDKFSISVPFIMHDRWRIEVSKEDDE